MAVREKADERVLETPSSEESGQSTEPEAALVMPPDGGWGWVVVAASFFCNLLVDGVIFSGGLLTTYIVDDLKVSEEKVSWMFSLLTGFYLLAGPFVGALANRYGFRLVTICGSLLGCTAMCLSYFTNNIAILYVTYGLFGGIGFCMMYLPSVITVGMYFEKWRALATGIALCGSGVGTLAIGALTYSLLDHLGWKHTVLFHGGCVLVCALCGLTFRPITPVTVMAEAAEDAAAENRKHKEAVEKLNTMLRLQHKLHAGLALPLELSARPAPAAAPAPHTWMGVPSNTTYPTAADVFRGSASALNRRASVNAAGVKAHLRAPRYTVVPVAEHDEDAEALPCDGNDEPLLQKQSQVEIRAKMALPRAALEPVSRPFYRDDIFFSGSLARLSQYRSNTSLGYHMAVTHVPTKADVREERARCRLCPEAVRRALATMLDVSLFRSPTFVLIAVSGLLIMLGFFVPYAYITRRAKETYHWSDGEAKWLIPAVGGANVVGRVLCGLLSSSESLSALWINNVAISLGGVATIISGVSGALAFQYGYCIVFGFAAACFASLRSILIVEYLGLERLTNSFGLLLLFQGVGALLGTPIAGMLYALNSDYANPFYVSGMFILLSAVICYPIDYISKWEKERDSAQHNKV